MFTLSDFDFDLPEDRIALHPAKPRDAARLLVVAGQKREDRVFHALPTLLRPGDLMVLNDTRVIPARLKGRRRRDDAITAFEALLVRRLGEDRWAAFARPGKRLKPGDAVAFGLENPACAAASLHAEVVGKDEEGLVTFRFEKTGVFLDEAIALVGAMPLPPYILEARKRCGQSDSPADATDYQSVFAARDGAVAAPTASLHFTPQLLEALARQGIGHGFVTLHVGAGTFLPVKVENLAEHRMHAEWGEVSAATAQGIVETRARGGRVIAVGTTACRLIETCAATGEAAPWRGETDIFIRPGHRWRATDGLITNFHLPKSTLLMLVCAFAGFEPVRAAYAHAVAQGYRFYSYGDACLLWPASAR